jgi:hypothetical protein
MIHPSLKEIFVIIEDSGHTYSLQEALNDLTKREGYERRIKVAAEHYMCFSMWCDKWWINKNSRLVGYIGSETALWGLNPKQTTIVFVCRWTLGKSQRTIDGIYRSTEILKDLGCEVLSDTCTRARIDSD